LPATCDAAVKGAGVLAADVPQVAAIGRTLKLRSASSLQFHIVYFADNCSKDKTTKKTRNKSNDYFESMPYRQDMRHIAHYHTRKHFPSYTRCSENHNNTCAENRKIRGLKFDTVYWRHLAAYRKI